MVGTFVMGRAANRESAMPKVGGEAEHNGLPSTATEVLNLTCTFGDMT